MFGFRIVIGAADNTARAVRGVEDRIKRFSRSVRDLFNFGGLILVFNKLGSAIDRAFKASTYAKEWDQFKTTMSSGFSDIIGRIADAWGPILDDVEAFGKTMLDVFNRIVTKVQWVGAALGAIVAGDFKNAAKVADATVKAMADARKMRKEAQAKPAEAQQAAEPQARGRITPWRTSIMANMRERAANRRRGIEMQKALREGRIYDAADAWMEHKEKTRLNRSVPLSEEAQAGSGFRRSGDPLDGAMRGMSVDDLRGLAMGPQSGIRAARKSAKKAARDERKWSRLVAQARFKESKGVRLSGRMRAVIAAQDAKDAELQAAADAQAVKQAQIDTAKNTKVIADEMTKGMTK